MSCRSIQKYRKQRSLVTDDVRTLTPVDGREGVTRRGDLRPPTEGVPYNETDTVPVVVPPETEETDLIGR